MGGTNSTYGTGEGRIGDYFLEGEKVFYYYRQWGDTTPESDSFNYGWVTTKEEKENPSKELLERLKSQQNQQ